MVCTDMQGVKNYRNIQTCYRTTFFFDHAIFLIRFHSNSGLYDNNLSSDPNLTTALIKIKKKS